MLDTIGYFKASNPDIDDAFSRYVAPSADGNTLAVGAHQEEVQAAGIGGDQSEKSKRTSGAVYLY